jgi:hypothetical protein
MEDQIWQVSTYYRDGQGVLTVQTDLYTGDGVLAFAERIAAAGLWVNREDLSVTVLYPPSAIVSIAVEAKDVEAKL